MSVHNYFTVLSVVAMFANRSPALASAPQALLFDTLEVASGVASLRRIEGSPEFRTGRFGQGVVCRKGDDKLVYPAAKTVNPLQGTVELWIEPQFDFGDSKNNEQILRISFGSENGIALYYNGGNQGFVFYSWDKDDPFPFHQAADLSTFLPSRKLFWRKGEKHHVTVTWQREVQRIYIDGEKDRHSFFEGGVKVDPKMEGTVVVGGGGRFLIEGIRIWDAPRAPRKLDQDFSCEASAESAIQGASVASTEKRLALHGCDIEMTVDDVSKAPLNLWAGASHKSWMKSSGSVAVRTLAGDPATMGQTTRWVEEENGRIVCETELRNADKEKVAVVDVVLTLPVLEADTMVFVAADESPFKAVEGRPFYDGKGQVVYGQDASLPLVTIYSPGEDSGFTVFSDDASVEDVEFDPGFSCDEGVLTLRRMRVEVAPGGKETRRWYFAGHAGDWRAGLRAYARRFPGILNPPQGPVATGDQGMIIGGPSDKAFLHALSTLGVGWRQISLFLGEGARFGNYIPDDLGPYAIAVDQVRKGLATALHHDLTPLLYIQARECHDVDRAEREFGESVVRLADGRPEVNKHGPFGATMTCRLGTAWFNHLIEQGRRELETFPDAAGFFFDNAWRNEYADILHALADLAHSQGKSLAANGGNARSVAWSDSIMAESYFTALGDLQYLGLSTPIVYVPIYSQGTAPGKERELRAPGVAENLQRDLKECLLSGAFYSFNYCGTNYWEAASSKMFADYLPLQRLLNGRRWVLTPHALRLSDGLDGNVFESPSGSWLATLVDEASDWTRPDENPARGGVVTLTRPDDREPVRATLHRLGGRSEPINGIVRDGRGWVFTLPPFHGAAILEVEWEGGA